MGRAGLTGAAAFVGLLVCPLGCDSGLQEPGEREPDGELDDGSQDFEPLDVADTRSIPYECETVEQCDDHDPCTRGGCRNGRCTYETVPMRHTEQSIETAAPALDVSLSSNRLYVAEGVYGIEVFDIDDLTSISKAGSAQTEGEAIAVEAHNNGVIVSEGEDGIETFTANGDLISHHPADSWPISDIENVQSVDIGPRHTVISGYADGVLIVDYSDISGPSPTQLINTGGRAQGAESTHSVAVVADALGGTGVVLFDDDRGPVEGIPISTEGRVRDVDIVWDTVLMAEHGAGFGVATISDPELPVRLVSYPSPAFIISAELLGAQTAAVLEWREEEERGRLAVWDIRKSFTGRVVEGIPAASPLAPQPIENGSVWISGKPEKMDEREGLIAVATDEGVVLFWTGCDD